MGYERSKYKAKKKRGEGRPRCKNKSRESEIKQMLARGDYEYESEYDA